MPPDSAGTARFKGDAIQALPQWLEAEAARQIPNNLHPSFSPLSGLTRLAPRDCPYPPEERLAPSPGILLRKEVIQPLVPQRLPCYDFIPVTNRTLDVYPPCGSNQRLWVQSAPMM